MVKIQENDGQHFITLPKELRKAMGWQKGDELNFSVNDSESLIISKVD